MGYGIIARFGEIQEGMLNCQGKERKHGGWASKGNIKTNS